jgi:hypothetical protein
VRFCLCNVSHLHNQMDKWIETRFSERLEAFKHQQNQEIEHLHFRINTMMDWNVKLHQREFDILPVAQRSILYGRAYRHRIPAVSKPR